MGKVVQLFPADRELVEQVEDFGPQLINIRYRSFAFRGDPGVKRVGVIAQELAERHPEFTSRPENGFMSVYYLDLILAKMAEMEWRIRRLEESFVVAR